jgi:hypothetical protein
VNGLLAPSSTSMQQSCVQAGLYYGSSSTFGPRGRHWSLPLRRVTAVGSPRQGVQAPRPAKVTPTQQEARQLNLALSEWRTAHKHACPADRYVEEVGLGAPS